VQSRHDSLFPWGTVSVNIAGGTLTTYSTFGYETLRLTQQRAYFYAAMNVVISVVAGLGATFLAYSTVSALAG
jgi:fluoride exporter